MDNFPKFLLIFSIALILLTSQAALTSAQTSPKDFVAAHNAARATVGVPPLVWNETVAAYAREYAAKRSEDCLMQHSGGPYGENLAFGSWAMSADEAVNIWVSEKVKYEQFHAACIESLECGHYTQVMWRDSARLGCATAPCKNGFTFVTCNYDPPGNYLGQRPY